MDVSDYDEINSIAAELSGYRKGSLAVFIDLEKGYLTWRESTRWCNNFTRTITLDQIKSFCSDLEICKLFNWRSLHNQSQATDVTDEPQQPRFAWQVRVVSKDKAWVREGENRLPKQWDAFCAAIERISRTSFRL
jgi:hypothetical protein